MTASVRVYRGVLRLYPRRFRQTYGSDMVFIFEEMLRDKPAARVWWRVMSDAATSIPVQRMELLMSQTSSRTLVTAFFSLFALVVALGVRGTPGTAFGLLFVAIAACGLMGVLYVRSTAAYVEPAMQMHRHWWRYLLAGAACFAGALIGTNVLNLDAWMLLVVDVIAGWFLVAVGVVFGAWHGVSRMRRPAVSR